MDIRTCFITICFFVVLELQLSVGQECLVNEVPVDCVDACNTCESTGQPCALICIPGCDCTPGYARDRFGVCIPRAYCNEGSLLLSDSDDIGVCPNSEKCANFCSIRGFDAGMCSGFTGRNCRCSNRRYPDVSNGPPNVEIGSSKTRLKDDGNGDWGIDGRRRGGRCFGKRRRLFGCRG